MKRLLLSLLVILSLALTSCEDQEVSNGRRLYQKHFREVLKDPESFTVYSETFTKTDVRLMLQKIGRKTPLRVVLSLWTTNGLIMKEGDNYVKLKKA